MNSYNVINNTMLFLRMTPILFHIENKCITNIRVVRPIIKTQTDGKIKKSLQIHSTTI